MLIDLLILLAADQDDRRPVVENLEGWGKSRD